MAIRTVLLAAALLISACSSDTTSSTAETSTVPETATTSVETTTSTETPTSEAVEPPAELALVDDGPLCVQINTMLDAMLRSELGSATDYSDFELLLPAELRGQATTGPIPVAAARGEAAAVDAYTTEQCGVAFVQSSIHITITCSTDRSNAELAQFIPDWGPCTDPRLEPDSVASLDEQMDAMDVLEQAIRGNR